MKRAGRLRLILRELSGFDPLSGRRRMGDVTAKMLMIKQLYDDGWLLREMEEYMGLNHSTIIYHRKRWNGIALPGWEDERELWNEFKKRVDELDRIESGAAQD